MNNDYNINISGQPEYVIEMVNTPEYVIEMINPPEYILELNEQGPQGAQGEMGPPGPQGEVGPQGPQGDAGPANTLSIGTVATGEEAEATITGESPNQVLNLVLPKGDKGDKGDQGDVGPRGEQGLQGIQGPVGPKGDTGAKGETGETGLQGPIGPQGISVTGVEEISKVGLVATYRMYFSNGEYFDYNVTDGSVEGITREDIIDKLGYEPASYTSVEGLTTRVETLEERIEDLTVAKFPNAVIIGTPHIEGGQVSNFSSSNYLQFPFVDISRGLPFDIYFSFTTANDITTQQNVLDSYFGIALAVQNGKGIMALSSNGTSWDIGTAIGTNNLQPNTTYYVKYSWTGTEYNASLSIDDQTYVPDMVLASNKSPYKTTIFIGGSPNLFGPNTSHPFKGTINFNKSKVVVNGITVWEGMADVGLASRANVSLNNLDEVGEARFTDLQTALNNCVDINSAQTITGRKVFNSNIGLTSGKQIIDTTTNKTIFGRGSSSQTFFVGAPEYSMTFRGSEERPTYTTPTTSKYLALKDDVDLKQNVLVSGTNIKTLNNESILGSGNIEVKSAPDLDNITINKNASDELQAIGVVDKNTGNAIYDWIGTKAEYDEQDIATLHPDWVCYITDDDESSQLNNPYSLGDSKYSPNELSNASWLASKGQWNSGTLYPSFYNEYVGKIGEPFGQGTVKAVGDATITEYDLVIDSGNTQFRLPTLDGSEDLISDNYVNVPLRDGGGNVYYAPANGWFSLHSSNSTTAMEMYLGTSTDFRLHSSSSPVAGGWNGIYLPVFKGDPVQVYYQSTKPDIFRFVYAKGDGTLYFYIGETVQDANLINAGSVFNDIATLKANTIIKEFVDGTSGYRIWASGYCEQWGRVVGGADGMSTIFFIKNFSEIPQVYVNRVWRPGGDPGATTPDRRQTTISPPTISSFAIWTNGWGNIDIIWKASGYLAQGEF